MNDPEGLSERVASNVGGPVLTAVFGIVALLMAIKLALPLDDVMLAMDVVDPLRHRQSLAERELSAEEHDQALFEGGNRHADVTVRCEKAIPVTDWLRTYAKSTQLVQKGFASSGRLRSD